MTPPADLTILDVIDSPSIWRSWFRDPATWAPWRAFLSALFGLPLDDDALALYQQCTGRTTPPTGGFNEVWLICGRRAGKSFVLALIAVFLAVFRDWSPYLSPGESAAIKVVAVDRRQARVIFRYALALLEKVPALARLIVSQSDDEIELSNGITIEVQTASFRSIRGFTIIALLADEIAFWRNEETSANPDAEVLLAGRAAMATLRGNAMLLTAGSPYARRGEQYRAWRTYHGKDDAPVLVWQAATRTMNATVPQEFIDEQMERDPEAGAAEYLAEFRSDLADYIDRAVVEAAVVPGRFELPPQPGISYIGAIDVSGGSSDSMALAIAHADPNGSVILDALREARPPFSPETEAARQAEFARAYGISRIVGDRYGGLWPVEAFARYGISYEAADRSKSDFYKDLLPLLNSGRAELLDNVRLVNQICALERRTARSGKDSIDHPPGSHDDVANACAIALVAAGVAAAPALWRADHLLVDRAPLPWPVSARSIYLTAAVDETGVWIGYWASGAERFPFPPDQRPASGPRVKYGPRCVLIDFERTQIAPDLFGPHRARAAQLAAMTVTPRHAPAGALGLSVIAPDLRSFATGQLDLVPPSFAETVLGDRERALLVAAAELGANRVKLAAPAAESSLSLPNPLGEIRTGAPPSAASSCALLGIVASIPREEWPREWRTPRSA